jgi:hypothetical protein
MDVFLPLNERKFDGECIDNTRRFFDPRAPVNLHGDCAETSDGKKHHHMLPIVAKADADPITSFHFECRQMGGSSQHVIRQSLVADLPFAVQQCR